jgi:hypothetical protein
MTMKAELPSRPQRGSALGGVFGSRFNSVVKLSFVLAFEDVDPRLTVSSNIQHYLPRTVDAVLDHRLRQATSCHGPTDPCPRTRDPRRARLGAHQPRERHMSAAATVRGRVELAEIA